MANMHGIANCSSSSSAPADSDDFSLFLHQIMLRSSSSSSILMVQKGNEVQSFRPTCSTPPEDQALRFQSSPFPGAARIPLPEPSPGLNSATCVGFTSPGACLPESAINVSSSSINSADNELIEEYDCESEEGHEGVVLEAPTKPTTSRNPSKRSRAAEVHNLSEKRRRSRINEKMKALQNLIPNSNKTDKASMLDEAIEYLKQLQLQVQLLTMRNGASLYPMCLPGLLQSNEISHMRIGYPEGIRTLNGNMARSIPMDQTTPTNVLFNYPNQEQTSVANLRKLNDSDSFGLETSTHIHPESFQLPLLGCSKGICLEEKLPSELMKVDLSRTNAVGYLGGKATSSVPFNEQAPDLEESSIEACILGRDQSRKILRNSDCETILVSHFDG